MSMSSKKIPVTLTYASPGAQPPIFLAGSFSEPPWHPQEMDVSTEDGEHHFHKEVLVEEGGHFQYKFRIGNGDWWALNEQAPTVTDDMGNRNNLLNMPVGDGFGKQSASDSSSPGSFTPESSASEGPEPSMPETAQPAEGVTSAPREAATSVIDSVPVVTEGSSKEIHEIIPETTPEPEAEVVSEPAPEVPMCLAEGLTQATPEITSNHAPELEKKLAAEHLHEFGRRVIPESAQEKELAATKLLSQDVSESAPEAVVEPLANATPKPAHEGVPENTHEILPEPAHEPELEPTHEHEPDHEPDHEPGQIPDHEPDPAYEPEPAHEPGPTDGIERTHEPEATLEPSTTHEPEIAWEVIPESNNEAAPGSVHEVALEPIQEAKLESVHEVAPETKTAIVSALPKVVASVPSETAHTKAAHMPDIIVAETIPAAIKPAAETTPAATISAAETTLIATTPATNITAVVESSLAETTSSAVESPLAETTPAEAAPAVILPAADITTAVEDPFTGTTPAATIPATDITAAVESSLPESIHAPGISHNLDKLPAQRKPELQEVTAPESTPAPETKAAEITSFLQIAPADITPAVVAEDPEMVIPTEVSEDRCFQILREPVLAVSEPALSEVEHESVTPVDAEAEAYADNAAEVADSAEMIDWQSSPATPCDEEAGRTGERRLSSTPISQVALTAAEVADFAAILGKNSSSMASAYSQDTTSGRSTPQEGPPLFAHECLVTEDAEIEPQHELGPVKPAISEPEPEAHEVDLNNPLIEVFPQDRLAILAHVRSAESRLNEDETSFDGVPASPVIIKSRSPSIDGLGSTRLDAQQSPLLNAIVEERHDGEFGRLPSPSQKFGSDRELNKVEEEEEPNEQLEDVGVHEQHGVSDVKKEEHDVVQSHEVEQEDSTKFKTSSHYEQFHRPDETVGFAGTQSDHITLREAAPSVRINPTSVGNLVVRDLPPGSRVEVQDAGGLDSQSVTPVQQAEINKVLDPIPLVGADVGKSTSVGGAVNGEFKVTKRTLPNVERPTTPIPRTKRGEGAPGTAKKIWRKVSFGWVGGLLGRLCDGERGALLVVSAILLLTVGPVVYFSQFA